MKLTVVGVGYVGLVAAAGFAQSGNTVICIDSDKNKITNLKKGIIPIYEPGLAEIVKENYKAKRLIFTTDLKFAVQNAQVIFLGVGTPSAPDGSANISAVIAVAKKIAEYANDYKIIVTKSTVPIGTHKLICNLIKTKTAVPFDYVSNPEFLKEGSAVEDFLKPDRVIIGTSSPKAQEIMQQLYAPFMRKGSRIIFMDAPSAETTKYAANVMLATRISFMNELSALCEKTGADIEKVRIGVGSDPRIGNSFLFAGAGFGGSCFPKDVKALIYTGKKLNCRQTIAEATQKANYDQHDKFANKIIKYFKGKQTKTTLAVWGLAFKAKTDDIRESPAIWCINKLLKAGFKNITAFDPEAMPNAKAVLGTKIKTTQNEYQALAKADALIIFTDWQQFRTPDFDKIKQKLARPVIFDGRNLYEPNDIKKLGFEYYCVGRA